MKFQVEVLLLNALIAYLEYTRGMQGEGGGGVVEWWSGGVVEWWSDSFLFCSSVVHQVMVNFNVLQGFSAEINLLYVQSLTFLKITIPKIIRPNRMFMGLRFLI